MGLEMTILLMKMPRNSGAVAHLARRSWAAAVKNFIKNKRAFGDAKLHRLWRDL